MANDILSRLKPPAGAVKKKRRVGRGVGSGRGKTCGRGVKGQRSRSGGGPHPRFEGGQMPIERRLPKRGFNNIFRKEFAVLNLRELEQFDAGATVDIDALNAKGLLPKQLGAGLKILGDGELTKALTVRAHRFSKSARKKIEAAGGTVEVLDGDQ